MLSLLSNNWPADASAARDRFVIGTISEQDESLLRQSMSTAEWQGLVRRRWVHENRDLIREGRESSDLTHRLLAALLEKP